MENTATGRRVGLTVPHDPLKCFTSAGRAEGSLFIVLPGTFFT